MDPRARRYVTLEGYAVEGGFDGAYQPATCYRPTIALGRHAGPGDALGLWHEYEQVLDLAATLGVDGVRLSVEWARIEPRQGEVDAAALERYAQVASYATSLGLGVTAVIIDAAWPAWLGLEAWLLPWVVPHVIEQSRRVVAAIDALSGVVIFASVEELVTGGYVESSSPPWRRAQRSEVGRLDADGLIGAPGRRRRLVTSRRHRRRRGVPALAGARTRTNPVAGWPTGQGGVRLARRRL